MMPFLASGAGWDGATGAGGTAVGGGLWNEGTLGIAGGGAAGGGEAARSERRMVWSSGGAMVESTCTWSVEVGVEDDVQRARVGGVDQRLVLLHPAPGPVGQLGPLGDGREVTVGPPAGDVDAVDEDRHLVDDGGHLGRRAHGVPHPRALAPDQCEAGGSRPVGREQSRDRVDRMRVLQRGLDTADRGSPGPSCTSAQHRSPFNASQCPTQ